MVRLRGCKPDEAGRLRDLGHQVDERLTQQRRVEGRHRTPEDQAPTCEALLLTRQRLDLLERQAAATRARAAGVLPVAFRFFVPPAWSRRQGARRARPPSSAVRRPVSRLPGRSRRAHCDAGCAAAPIAGADDAGGRRDDKRGGGCAPRILFAVIGITIAAAESRVKGPVAFACGLDRHRDVVLERVVRGALMSVPR